MEVGVKIRTVDDYIATLPSERKEAVSRLREAIAANIPHGFEEMISYRMPGFSVPHSKYPAGYHCDPKIPLPFIGYASQKNFIALYHMGIYADSALLKWFRNEFPKYSKVRLDMGKSCVRFKKPEHIPFELIEKLAAKMSADQWIERYVSVLRKK
jgi:uncharacterized protein YdhG (YjbR/CyaY superfamily)